MTPTQTIFCIIIASIIAAVIIIIIRAIVNRIIEDKEVDTAIEDAIVTLYPGTGDPQFDELASLAFGIVDDTKDFLEDIKSKHKRLDEQSDEMLELSLQLQRLTLRKELLDEITLDNFVEKWGHLGLGWTTARLVIEYAQLKILELTSD